MLHTFPKPSPNFDGGKGRVPLIIKHLEEVPNIFKGHVICMNIPPRKD